MTFLLEMRCFITEHYFKTELYESVRQHFKNCFGDEYPFQIQQLNEFPIGLKWYSQLMAMEIKVKKNFSELTL